METNTYQALKYNNQAFAPVQDALAVEEMLSISINGQAFTITMRTPGFEPELVRGLLFSEQVYTDTETQPVIEITARNEMGYVTAVNVIAKPQKLKQNFANKRSMMSVSSCGICGKTELDTTLSGNIQQAHETLQPQMVAQMFGIMAQHQRAFQSSGGCHAAAAFTLNAQLLDIKEDIGRHNAVDKVIGSLLLKNQLSQARCLVVSGRISYEIVSKTYYAGMPFLAAVSAPSSMAVDYCKQTGITLMAFCRNNYFTIYATPSGIQQ